MTPAATTAVTGSPALTPTPTPALAQGAVVIEPGGALRLGVSAALSGANADVGVDIRDAVVLAVEDFGPDVLGFPIEVRALDDGCTNGQQAVAAAEAFADDPAVIAVVGPMCSDGAVLANPAYERDGLLHVSASASMPALTEPGSPLFFRTVWRDDRQGAVLAAYAFDRLGARSAVAVDSGGTYGEAIASEFARVFAERGAFIARETVAVGQRDFSGVIERIIAAAPNVVFFGAFPHEGVPFISQLREAGYTGLVLASDSLFDRAGFVAAAGDAADDVIVSGASPLPDEVAARFQARFGREARSPFAAHAYDAATALLSAIDGVASEQDGRLIIDKTAVAERLRATVYRGLTGAMRFNLNGDRVGLLPQDVGLALYTVKGGAFVLLEGPPIVLTPVPSPTPAAPPATETPAP